MDKHIKLLEENIRLNNHDLEFSSGLVDMTPKAHGRKNRWFKRHQNEKLLCIKEHYIFKKWEDNLQKIMYLKGLISRIFKKKSCKLKKKKKRQPNFKMGKGYEKTFFQRRHKYDQ